MEKKEEQKQKTTPRTYSISSKQLMDIMRYLMTRPYGEVVQLMTRPYGEVFSLMNQISQLKPFNPERDKDVGKK